MTEYGVTDIWAYIAGAIAIILLPGPNSLYVLTTATQRGIRAGYQGACGIFVGDTILMLLTAMGAAGLMHTYPFLFLIVKYAGGAYLAWIGVSLLWSALKSWRKPVNEVQDIENPMDEERHLPQSRAWWDLNHPFMRALVISLMNPKAIIFLLSFFVQFVDPQYPNPAVPFLILGVVIQILSALYLSALIFSGSKVARAFGRRPRWSAAVAGAVGVLFIAFAAKLANSRLQ